MWPCSAQLVYGIFLSDHVSYTCTLINICIVWYISVQASVVLNTNRNFPRVEREEVTIEEDMLCVRCKIEYMSHIYILYVCGLYLTISYCYSYSYDY